MAPGRSSLCREPRSQKKGMLIVAPVRPGAGVAVLIRQKSAPKEREPSPSQ
jgi:hypothetical protein